MQLRATAGRGDAGSDGHRWRGAHCPRSTTSRRRANSLQSASSRRSWSPVAPRATTVRSPAIANTSPPCGPSDDSWPRRSTAPRCTDRVGISGTARTAVVTWAATGRPQTPITSPSTFQSNAQPPFHKGTAVAVFALSGSDANGNYFDYSKRVTVSITLRSSTTESSRRLSRRSSPPSATSHRRRRWRR